MKNLSLKIKFVVKKIGFADLRRGFLWKPDRSAFGGRGYSLEPWALGPLNPFEK